MLYFLLLKLSISLVPFVGPHSFTLLLLHFNVAIYLGSHELLVLWFLLVG